MIFIADGGFTTGEQPCAVAVQKTFCLQVMGCLLIPLCIVNNANSSLQSSSSFAFLDKNILSGGEQKTNFANARNRSQVFTF